MLDSHGSFKILDKVVNNDQLSFVSDDGHVVGRVDNGGTSLKYSLAWDYVESKCEHGARLSRTDRFLGRTQSLSIPESRKPLTRDEISSEKCRHVKPPASYGAHYVSAVLYYLFHCRLRSPEAGNIAFVREYTMSQPHSDAPVPMAWAPSTSARYRLSQSGGT